MKTKKKIAFLGMIFLLCFFITGATTQAKQTRTVINFTFAWDVIGDPDRMWETPSGIWQLRDSPHFGQVLIGDADFYGDLYLLSSLILFDDLLAPTTFNSIGWGTFEFTGNFWEQAVGFTGQINFKIENWHMNGKFTVHGIDGWEGSLIKGTIEGSLLDGINYVQMTIMN